jgi:hypothetical protein
VRGGVRLARTVATETVARYGILAVGNESMIHIGRRGSATSVVSWGNRCVTGRRRPAGRERALAVRSWTESRWLRESADRRDLGRSIDGRCHAVLVDDDIEAPDLCSYCRSALAGDGSTLWVDISGAGGSLLTMFCSREHLTAFFVRPLPELEPVVEESKAKRALVVGSKIALTLAVAVLTVIGARTVFLFLQG